MFRGGPLFVTGGLVLGNRSRTTMELLRGSARGLPCCRIAHEFLLKMYCCQVKGRRRKGRYVRCMVKRKGALGYGRRTRGCMAIWMEVFFGVAKWRG